MKFAHLADIHIRNTVRHEEYAVVFERLCSVLLKQKPDRIVISGDLLHSKTILSPESVLLVKQFLLALAVIAPVDIILGNHDLNMSNSDRKDAISAIIADVREADNPISILRESGVFDIDKNFRYGIFSVLDEESQEKYPTHVDDSKINIALFHGTVNQSKSSLNYVLESKTSIDVFKGYDFGFLGDIHRPQGFNEQIHEVEEEIDEHLLEEYQQKYPSLKIV